MSLSELEMVLLSEKESKMGGTAELISSLKQIASGFFIGGNGYGTDFYF